MSYDKSRRAVQRIGRKRDLQGPPEPEPEPCEGCPYETEGGGCSALYLDDPMSYEYRCCYRYRFRSYRRPGAEPKRRKP